MSHTSEMIVDTVGEDCRADSAGAMREAGGRAMVDRWNRIIWSTTYSSDDCGCLLTSVESRRACEILQGQGRRSLALRARYEATLVDRCGNHLYTKLMSMRSAAHVSQVRPFRQRHIIQAAPISSNRPSRRPAHHPSPLT